MIHKEEESALLSLWNSADALENAVLSGLSEDTGTSLGYSYFVLERLAEEKDRLTENLITGSKKPQVLIESYEDWLDK